MKNYSRIFIVLLALTACSVDSKRNTSELANAYDSKKVYERSEYTYYGGVFYQATTTVRGRSPRNFVSSSAAPMNPWRRSSKSEYRMATSLTTIKTVPNWQDNTIYHAGNVVVNSAGEYFRSMWWNTDEDPTDVVNRNAYDDGTETHWGPWIPISREEAEGELEKPTDPDVTPPIDPELPDGGGTVDPDDKDDYAWDEKVAYIYDMVAVHDNQYWISKWWNMDEEPMVPLGEVWDSPWKKITEGQFEAIINGVQPPTPPDVLPDPDVPTDPDVAPGYEKIVAQGFIQEWDWNDADMPAGVKKAFNDAAVVKGNIFATQDGQGALNIFKRYINKAKWEQLFPRRRGAKGWEENTGKTAPDFYSFDNFSAAMLIVGEYAYMRDVALDGTTAGGRETSFERNYVLHKPTKKVRLISQSSDYFADGNDWLTKRYHLKKVVDYAAFGREGTDNDKKRVVAGFLAHASHETSGSWASAPGWPFDKDLFGGANFPDYITTSLPGELAWSLFFNEEVAFAGATSSHYNDPNNKIFPPTPGFSYHGRGAFQLTWNYNYGLASAIFFGDSNVLLDNPNMIMTGGRIPRNSSEYGTDTWRAGEQIEGGTMAFLTSLMFWLTPQGAKPSQQDTMILNRNDGRYIRGTSKLVEDSGLGKPGYGWTINIMNGGYEANKSWQPSGQNYDAKVARRVKHYKFFTQALGGNNDGEVLDTLGNHSY